MSRCGQGTQTALATVGETGGERGRLGNSAKALAFSNGEARLLQFAHADLATVAAQLLTAGAEVAAGADAIGALGRAVCWLHAGPTIARHALKNAPLLVGITNVAIT